MREMSGTFLNQEPLPITLAGPSGQHYQVVSCFQRNIGRRKRAGPGDQLVGSEISLVIMDVLSGLSPKSLGTHLASEI